MSDEDLIFRILEERRRIARQKPGVPYYMVNIGHPAVVSIYEKWRAQQGPRWAPPSDEARTAFELQMMSSIARQMLEDHFETIDRLKRIYGEGEKKEETV